ncbi:nuclear pore complex-interacting protein family member B4 [Drosophila tropicalis]|uniref:nuclear pore complex-interacting protein family member B4 n=1 Tax=Drosophila tropicalis TaxID=46794 RepID=UPI0035ABEBAB
MSTYPPVEVAPAHELADDGYRYKTNKRVVLRRHRRDVSHLPSNEYLPPVEAAPSNEYLPPVQVAAPISVPVEVEAAPAHELADDGYRYKTHKRVVLRRHRRDVSHLPSNEYLPPVQESVEVAAPSAEYLTPVEAPVESAVLADDGYRYKTHKRVVLRRHRRDVSHLPSNEYLPPVEAAPSNEYLPPVQVAAPISVPVEVEAAPAHELADDGYRYKTHKRVVLRRHRRDVSHLPSNEYLPPVQESVEVAAPSAEYLTPVEAPVESAVLADDGYRYKTHKRVVLRRHRRDVSHLPSNEYLPPVQESVEVAAPSAEYLTPVEAPVESAVLADDGYRYKTHKRVVLRRHRRDVSHLPSNEYLPPVQESVEVAAPSAEYLTPVEAPVESAVLADDGYRYKTHKRVVLRRHRRDVSHLPSNEYLPPVQESVEVAAPSAEYLTPVEAPVESAVLADDGYRYKTHKRVVLRRHRRDVSHLPSNEYLPPVQESVEIAAPSNEYLGPVDNVLGGDSAVLADDGYRYKTQKRRVFRRH